MWFFWQSKMIMYGFCGKNKWLYMVFVAKSDGQVVDVPDLWRGRLGSISGRPNEHWTMCLGASRGDGLRQLFTPDGIKTSIIKVWVLIW